MQIDAWQRYNLHMIYTYVDILHMSLAEQNCIKTSLLHFAKQMFQKVSSNYFIKYL